MYMRVFVSVNWDFILLQFLYLKILNINKLNRILRKSIPIVLIKLIKIKKSEKL